MNFGVFSFLFWNIFADWLVVGEKSSTFAAQKDGNRVAWGHRDARESGESPELYLQL